MTKETALSAQHDTVQTIAAMTSEQTEVDEVLLQTYTAYINLTGTQRLVLVGLLRNIVSDSTQTDTDLAVELGISRWTIMRCRNHRVFQDVLAQISIDVIRGKADKVIKNLFVLGEKSVSANELLLKVSGLYIPQSQQAVLHGKIDDAGQIRTPADALGKICRQFNRVGYTKERLVEELTATWAQLEDEGAL